MKRPAQIHTQTWLLLLSTALHLTSAQQVVFTSYYVTQCVDADHPPQYTGQAGGGGGSPGQGSGETVGHVSYTMPECLSCGCSTCTATSTFTTAFPAFCPEASSGSVNQVYTVTETYVGVSQLPKFASATEVPFGFTTSVATCTACTGAGGNGLVATMTYPQDRTPFASNSACAQAGSGGSSSSGGGDAGDDGDLVGQAVTTEPAIYNGNVGGKGTVAKSGAISGRAQASWGAVMLVAAAAVAACL